MNPLSNSDKIMAIHKLAHLAEDFPQIEEDMVAAIVRVAGPEEGGAYVKNWLEPTIDELATAKREGKIPAIKAHRNRTGLGLKESKEAIELAGHKLGFYFKDGCVIPGGPADVNRVA